jgi:excisionase family DNA binding protein
MSKIQDRHEKNEVRLLTVKQVAGILGLGRTKVYDLVLCGDIPSVKFTRARRVPSNALQNYIADLVDSSVVSPTNNALAEKG